MIAFAFMQGRLVELYGSVNDRHSCFWLPFFIFVICVVLNRKYYRIMLPSYGASDFHICAHPTNCNSSGMAYAILIMSCVMWVDSHPNIHFVYICHFSIHICLSLLYDCGRLDALRNVCRLHENLVGFAHHIRHLAQLFHEASHQHVCHYIAFYGHIDVSVTSSMWENCFVLCLLYIIHCLFES